MTADKIMRLCQKQWSLLPQLNCLTQLQTNVLSFHFTQVMSTAQQSDTYGRKEEVEKTKSDIIHMKNSLNTFTQPKPKWKIWQLFPFISKSDKLFNETFYISFCSKQRIFKRDPGCYKVNFQGWIQTSSTSFQKVVRIVKKFKQNLRKPCQKVSTARCQFAPGV